MSALQQEEKELVGSVTVNANTPANTITPSTTSNNYITASTNNNSSNYWALTTHQRQSILDRRDITRHSLLSLSPVERRVIVGAGRTGIAIGEGILLHGHTLINPILSAALVLYSTGQVVRSYYNGTPNRLGYRTSAMDVGLHIGKELLLTATGIGIGQVVGAVIGLSALPLAGQIIVGTVLSVGIGIGIGTLLTRYVDRVFVRLQIRHQYHYPSDEAGARRRFEELLQSRHDLATLETCTIVQHYADYRVACGWESANDVDDYRASRDIRHMPISFQHFAIIQLQRKWGFLNDHAGCKKVYKALMLLHHPDRRGGNAALAAQLNSDYEIYAFCQGWDEDCPTLLSSGRVDVDEDEESEEELEEKGEHTHSRNSSTKSHKTKSNKFTRLPRRHVVVDFLRSLFRPVGNSIHDANDLHQFGLLTLEAGPHAATVYTNQLNNRNHYLVNESTKNISSNVEKNNNNNSSSNNMSISFNSFSDIDLDDDVVRYIRHAYHNTSFTSQPASLTSSFTQPDNSFDNCEINSNTEEPTPLTNTCISGLVLQRGVSKVLSAVEQSYRNAVEAITFSELVHLISNEEKWRTLCEQVYLFNRLQCYLTISHQKRELEYELEEEEEQLAVPIEKVEISNNHESNKDNIIKENNTKEELECRADNEEYKQCQQFTWRTPEEAIHERERLRMEIISAVFTEEINHKLLLASDLWQTAQTMAQNYYKECANDITARVEDGATQIIDTLLAIRHRLAHLSEAHEPFTHEEHTNIDVHNTSTKTEKVKQEVREERSTDAMEHTKSTKTDVHDDDISKASNEVHNEHGAELAWWHTNRQTRHEKILQLKLVALTASSALAAEHARQVQIHAEDVCSAYFATWERKQETIRVLEAELHEAELMVDTKATSEEDSEVSSEKHAHDAMGQEKDDLTKHNNNNTDTNNSSTTINANASLDETRATQIFAPIQHEHDTTWSMNDELNLGEDGVNVKSVNKNKEEEEDDITENDCTRMAKVVECPSNNIEETSKNSKLQNSKTNSISNNNNNNNNTLSRIDDFVTQLMLTQQQLAEIDSLVLELYDLCWLHFPEKLNWLSNLPSSISRCAHWLTDMPRFVKYERERLMRSYVHVQDEPNVYIAPMSVQTNNVVCYEKVKNDTNCSTIDTSSSSSSNNNDNKKIIGEEPRLLYNDEELQSITQVKGKNNIIMNETNEQHEEEEEEEEITISFKLLRAVYVDPLSNAFSTCWLKQYTFTDNVVNTNLMAIINYIVESELRMSEHCNSPYITSPSELFATSCPLTLNVHIPRAATQERFSSVHDVARRVAPLGLQWLHNALTCVIELHSCFLAHGNIALHHFTYDEFGNTTLGYFNQITWCSNQCAKTNSYTERTNQNTHRKTHYNTCRYVKKDSKVRSKDAVMLACSDVVSSEEFAECVRKDTVDFGVMLLSEIIPYWGNASEIETNDNLCCTNKNASTNNPGKNTVDKTASSALTRKENLENMSMIGEHLIGKGELHYTLLDARFCVRRYLQFNYDDYDRSYFVNTQFTFPASWAVRHPLLCTQITRDYHTYLHIECSINNNVDNPLKNVDMYLNRNVALWELYWRHRRKMMERRTHTYTLPSIIKDQTPIIFCADDWEVNERYMWYPCKSEEEAWQLCQTGFSHKSVEEQNIKDCQQENEIKDQIELYAQIYVNDKNTGTEQTRIGDEEMKNMKNARWGTVCRVLLGTAVLVNKNAANIDQTYADKADKKKEEILKYGNYQCKIGVRQNNIEDDRDKITVMMFNYALRCYPEYVICLYE